MINLKSTAVKVFPSAFRGLAENGTTQYNPEARLTTEFNVTNLTNRLSSKDSFVIDWTGSLAIFNIHGYYFEADLTDLLGVGGAGAAWDDVYAYIKVLPFQATDGGNTTYKAFTLVGADDVGSTVAPTTGRVLDETLSSVDTFMGLGLQGTQKTGTLDTGVYGLHLLYKDGATWSVPTASKLKFKSTEIEDSTAGKSIYEELSTGKITLSGKINNIKVTAPTTEATLTIAEGKTLEVNDDITVGTSAITLASNKALTMQYAGLKVGGLNKTGDITLTSNTSDDRTLTLTGSPSLSGITTTGTGTLALNTNLTVNGANKTLAGAGTSLTIDNNLDIAGTTGQITLGTDAHTLEFTTTDDTEVTLPISGTLYGTKENSISSSELALSVSDETGSGSLVFATSPNLTTPSLGVATATSINGLTLTSNTTGFEISGGTTYTKNLTITSDVTVNSGLKVGETSTNTGKVIIRSTGTSQTTITGPNNGEAKLIAGTYTSSATTANSVGTEPTIGDTLVKRTSNGFILSNGVSVTSVNTEYLNSVLLSNIFESDGATVKNATKATKTAFTNNSFYGPITISSSGDTPAPLLLVGRTYQIYISFEGNPYDNKWSLGLIRIPGGLDESVFTMLSAGGHYLQFYHATVEEHSSVTCWAKGPDNNISKTGCNLYYKLIS